MFEVSTFPGWLARTPIFGARPGAAGANDAAKNNSRGSNDDRNGGDPMIRVLVVEDHRALADSLRVAIDAEPDLACVGAVTMAEEAVRLTAEEHPDVVLMDIHLPGADGIEGTKWIKVSDPEVRVLILTADAAPQLFEDATAAGAAGFIAKDSPFNEILTAIRTPADKTIMVGGATFAALFKHRQREEPPPGRAWDAPDSGFP